MILLRRNSESFARSRHGPPRSTTARARTGNISRSPLRVEPRTRGLRHAQLAAGVWWTGTEPGEKVQIAFMPQVLGGL